MFVCVCVLQRRTRLVLLEDVEDAVAKTEPGAAALPGVDAHPSAVQPIPHLIRQSCQRLHKCGRPECPLRHVSSLVLLCTPPPDIPQHDDASGWRVVRSDNGGGEGFACGTFQM